MVFVDLNLGKTSLNPHAKQYLEKSLKMYRSVCMTKKSELFMDECRIQCFGIDFSVSMVWMVLWLNHKTEPLGKIPGYSMWSFQSAGHGCTSKQHKIAPWSVAPVQIKKALKSTDECCAAWTCTHAHKQKLTLNFCFLVWEGIQLSNWLREHA